MSAPLVPCIWLADQAEAAAAAYLAVFPSAAVIATARYPEHADNPAGRPPGSVITVELELAGQRFTLLNGGPMFKPNPSVSFFVHCDTPDEATRVYGALADGGQPLMPLDRYPWSERYGWIQDRFGVSWQVITGRRAAGGATIVPCLMFVGAQHGRAAEAMARYAAVFPGSGVDDVERYAAGEGPPDMVKHGRFHLGAQPMVAMDAHGGHGFAFDEGVSLQVMCADQAELDRYWDALGDGGRHGPCGWLTDRFGLSWQVVPASIAQWMTSPDVAARDRAFAAVMTMGKLDIAAIERAFAGG